MRNSPVLRARIFNVASSKCWPKSRVRVGAQLLPMLCLVLAMPALADDDDHDGGRGYFSFAYQTIEVNRFDTSVSEVDIGEVLTHSLYLEFAYAITDRWQLQAGIPFVKKRYNGAGRHDPLTLEPPRPEVPFIDDGDYHSNFQDFFLGASYLWITDPVIVEPFARLFIPSQDYPHFGNSAVGQNLWKMEFGVDLTKFMPFSDWFYRLETSYTFVEETLGVNVNHFRINGEVGYFFTQEFAANVFVQSKLGRGEDATNYPPSNRTGERWYQHDRTTRHSYVNAGVGADWFFHEKYQLSGSVFTTVWGESVHLINVAWGIKITRYF